MANNQVEKDNDSRERLLKDLESLVQKWHKYNGNFMQIYSSVAYAQIKELLDRQAAITRREREKHWLEIIGASAKCNLELASQITKLQDEINELIRRLEQWQKN